MSDLEVYTLPEALCLPLVASWRTMEKSLNPVFSFVMKCSSCGKLSDSNNTQGPSFVMSNKKKNGMPILIGIQCKTEGCGMVIKFEAPVSPGNPDFPSHLQNKPPTGLTDPKGKTGKQFNAKKMAVIEELLDLG